MFLQFLVQIFALYKYFRKNLRNKKAQIFYGSYMLVSAKLLKKGFKCGKFVKLQECFHMPRAMIDQIESDKILPTSDLSKAKGNESLGVVNENIDFSAGYSIQLMAEELSEQLYTKVMKRGIHPGHCAVVFDDEAVTELFPPQEGGLTAFVQLVNTKLKAMTANKKDGCMLQISQDLEETLLYNRHHESSDDHVKSVNVEQHAEVT